MEILTYLKIQVLILMMDKITSRVTSEESGATSTQGATSSNTPASGGVAGTSSNNAVQLSQLKEIIASITPPDGSGRKRSYKKFQFLEFINKPEILQPNVEILFRTKG